MGWEEGPFFTFPQPSCCLRRSMDTMKDTPFPTSPFAAIPKKRAAAPFSQQTPTRAGRGTGQVPPTPPSPSSMILGCFSRRQMRLHAQLLVV